jgi:hypothetical protein
LFEPLFLLRRVSSLAGSLRAPPLFATIQFMRA